MIMIPRIIDTVDVLNNEAGIFQTIQALNVFEWLDSDTAKEYDRDYYLSYSADKRISLTYYRLLKLEDDGKISSALTEIAKIILNRHKDDWDRLYELMTAEYDPLNSYNITETETPDITKTRTNDFKTKTESSNNLHGFNTTEALGVGVSNGEVTVSGSADDNITTDTESGTRTRTKIGYDTHPLENILKELEVLRYNLFESLASDVDSVLTNLFYNGGF